MPSLQIKVFAYLSSSAVWNYTGRGKGPCTVGQCFQPARAIRFGVKAVTSRRTPKGKKSAHFARNFVQKRRFSRENARFFPRVALVFFQIL
jgi:hypothetical protein